MIFSKKGRNKQGQKKHDEKSLYPILHVAGSLKEYQKDLSRKEVESLFEMSMVKSSFSGVLTETDQFQSQLQDFGQSFSNINEAAGQFMQVRDDITKTVSEAQNMVEELKLTSMQVQASYSEMETTFEQLQSAVKEIQHCMGKISSIADETNILAINASIEAARAGQQGKGFAVVAVEVKKLADQIKNLTGEVDSGIHDVEAGTERLNNSIAESQKALGESLFKVNETYDMFDEITQSAEGAKDVQSEISKVIDESKMSLQMLCGFFEQLRSGYQEVVKHISKASKLGTTKSAMFEDIDNMMGQIPPIIKEHTKK